MRRSITLLFVTLLVLAMVSPARAAAGDLDTAFDGDGVAVVTFSSSSTSNAVVVQGNGKIILAGAAGDDFGLARLDLTGALDPTFGSGGTKTTDFRGHVDVASDAALTSSKLIVVGTSRDSTTGETTFAVARYRNGGKLDHTFDGATAVAVQADDKIVVGGYVDLTAQEDFGLARYNTDGSFDTTFDGDGLVTTDFVGDDDQIAKLAIQSDGKIVAVGFANDATGTRMAVARYNTDGSLDTTFAGDGLATTTFAGSVSTFGWAVAIQSDGKIVVAGENGGSPGGDQVIVRYDAAGNLDPTFSGDGKKSIDFGGTDVAYGVAIQADGRIVLAGKSDASGALDYTVARVDADGTPDGTFGVNGMVTTDLGTAIEAAFDVGLEPDGKIVVTGIGFVNGDLDFLAIRYLAV